MNYYNDFDKKACAWLRELIKASVIPDGIVDDRSITDVTANDLRGFTQCHFFAGIGGWPRALQIAGWPADRKVWTGSCPCQPFSSAGKGDGKSDERHLWPSFARLIAECRPDVVFGEQVEGAIKHGWIDDLQADMEREDYAVGYAVLGAHSLGAPHIRQRLYWVANANKIGLSKGEVGNLSEVHPRKTDQRMQVERTGLCSGAADADGEQDNSTDEGRLHAKSCCKSAAFRVANAQGDPGRSSEKRPGQEQIELGARRAREPSYLDGRQPCQNNSFWGTADWLFCRDGKWRPVEPGTFPLADGVPGKMGLLRGYGNAIVPQVAAEFVKAFMEVTK